MSAKAILETTQALKTLLENSLNPSSVYVGPPIREELGSSKVSLFLFHIQPNAELRNEVQFEAPPNSSPATSSVKQVNGFPLDLRYMITVFRERNLAVESPDPEELNLLGTVILALHQQSTLLVSESSTQKIVRVTPEPYPMEEISRIWSLFPNEVYRTSIIYLVSPVFINTDIRPTPPVIDKSRKTGLITEGLSNTREELRGL